MASSDNLASIEPWTLRPSFTDSLFPEAFACDYQAVTIALQKSLSGSSSDTIPPFLNLVNPDTTPSSTVSGLSGSDQETAPKPQKNTVLSATGKVSKRKSRASKRSQTTFIAADPMNFRQMVQQVTGARLDNSPMPMAPISKPEPQRPRSRLPSGELFLPTLDTSSFFLDHHHQQQQETVGFTSAAGHAISGPAPLTFEASVGAVDADLESPASEFDTYLNFPTHFPTLESWKVM
ncbi:calmodulin-binding protein 25-like [Prosopis cineraria]|uniref:calmodulin-binding protein 25-like n=1 Tax=Prosopis cineraria TaxID=364024 RepID=UPI00240ED9BE|nr:calmodulin-binding protein 25-like [Prosopis cineraria]